MTSLLERLPWWIVIILCVFLGLAPFYPQPHLVEKLQMLGTGELRKAIDIFDLFYHASPFLLVLLKLIFKSSRGTSR